MRINTNINAMNAQRNLNSTAAQFSKSVEKLSSGLRINRAADDAAGLSISEKLRAQVRGLNQAMRNAQDGISLMQTAEGALNETHSILQRMNELALQATNGTLSDDDKKAIVSELKQLKSEVDRIATVTDFNGTKLLSGNGVVTAGTAAVVGAVTKSDATSETATISGTFTGSTNTSYVLKVASITGADAGTQMNVATFEVSTDGGVTYGSPISVPAVPASTNSAVISIGNGLSVQYAFAGTTTTVGDTYSFTATAATGSSVGAVGAELQIGANTSASERLTVNIGSTLSAYMGFVIGGAASLDAAVTAVDVASPTAANFRALADSSQKALKDVSAVRSNLGASQNRLEHTIRNLGVAAENLQASESRIRDLDMAAEMVNFTKSQILQQAGTAILAQANQSTQNVLSLLR